MRYNKTMKRLLSTITLILALTTFSIVNTPLAYAAKQPSTSYITGVDVSWPNCLATVPSVGFGIVGVTDGHAYSTNPCLKQEASKFTNLSLYVNADWNSSSVNINATSPKSCATSDLNCLAYNYGYNAGINAYNASKSAGVTSTKWWLDVETGNTWSTSTVENQYSLQGEYDALTSNGNTVGVYSTTYQWNTITGSWLNYWNSWGATAWTTASGAYSYCTGHEFTGGKSVYMQYKARNSSVDQDVQC